jgi:hypothetical protein
MLQREIIEEADFFSKFILIFNKNLKKDFFFELIIVVKLNVNKLKQWIIQH